MMILCVGITKPCGKLAFTRLFYHCFVRSFFSVFLLFCSFLVVLYSKQTNYFPAVSDEAIQQFSWHKATFRPTLTLLFIWMGVIHWGYQRNWGANTEIAKQCTSSFKKVAGCKHTFLVDYFVMWKLHFVCLSCDPRHERLNSCHGDNVPVVKLLLQSITNCCAW